MTWTYPELQFHKVEFESKAHMDLGWHKFSLLYWCESMRQNAEYNLEWISRHPFYKNKETQSMFLGYLLGQLEISHE